MSTALIDKLFDRIRKTDACWEWTGTVNGEGYGSFTLYTPGGKGEHRATHAAHRLVYTELVGPIPDGLTLDHLCHNVDSGCAGGRQCRHRRCVNPEHLEPVAFEVNVSRGLGPTADNARKTRCVSGHEFTPENTYVRPEGGRECRECIRTRNRQRKSALRAAAQPRIPRCRRGHEFTPENTMRSAGRRRCKACRDAWWMKNRDRLAVADVESGAIA
ncbi:hypothetical protein JNW88_00205 [Micromonospora sp. ATA32]|nr:hypothetical protein [Micromonospora sp. ATA32]